QNSSFLDDQVISCIVGSVSGFFFMAKVRVYSVNPVPVGSETSGLAMLLVRACGAETFVSWTLLERAGVQRHTVLATLRIIYPYEEMRGVWTSFMLSSHCLVCVTR
ncbi:unnamed protein product, partial [Brassica rapa]